MNFSTGDFNSAGPVPPATHTLLPDSGALAVLGLVNRRPGALRGEVAVGVAEVAGCGRGAAMRFLDALVGLGEVTIHRGHCYLTPAGVNGMAERRNKLSAVLNQAW